VLLCAALPCVSQGLTVEVKGGLRLSGDESPYGPLETSTSKRYLVGPSVEVGLPFHFAFEADALYSRLGRKFWFPGIGREADIRTTANAWVFPLLIKYRVPVPRVHPFLSAGYAPRRTSGSVRTAQYDFFGNVTHSSVDWHAHDRAIVAGGGMEFRFGHARISPEVRYLRWHVPSNPFPDQTAYYLDAIHSNEVQFVLGIGWSSR